VIVCRKLVTFTQHSLIQRQDSHSAYYFHNQNNDINILRWSGFFQIHLYL